MTTPCAVGRGEELITEEEIGYFLVVVALYHFDLWQRGLKK
ncbi:MAG TPA: hypothetical protein VN836_03225 [Verrucomicrobiae bacterium]|nr:hypothetical protein [Verrucomicrobiae bacterium]